jgi:hypothetical protein
MASGTGFVALLHHLAARYFDGAEFDCLGPKA